MALHRLAVAPLSRWKDTATALQPWTLLVGKIRLARTPWLNYSWHVALYVTARVLRLSIAIEIS